MAKDKLDRLEEIVGRLGEDAPIDEDELRAIAKELEAGEKYTCATCQMFCTAEDVMVIFDTETEEFIQIEVPMDAELPVEVTRVS
ncbi:MAG: hypothetical protein ACOCP3_03285 [Halodesulfurarchaeum sp.]